MSGTPANDTRSEVQQPSTQASDDVLTFPAALAQSTFWFLDQLEPRNPAFNVAVRFDLKGPLDRRIVELAFNEMIRRHESLRTYFVQENDELLQLIVPNLEISVGLTDISGLPADKRAAEADRLGTIEAQRPLDLGTLPLIRVGLIRVAPDHHILQVTVHHAIADGWSIGLITDEFGALYEALAAGKPSPLPPLPIQFADFTMWQREFMDGPEIAGQIAYWKHKLANHVEPNFPTDHPRPAVKRWTGDIVSILLPKELTDRLQGIGQQHGATLFMVFLATFKVLLARYTGQGDIAIGSPIVGRTRKEIENLIGVFINTVILRTDLSGNPSFGKALDLVRTTAVDAMANQDLPFEALVRELQPARDPGRMPLFQINFTHQRDFVKPVHFAGIQLTAIPSRPVGAIFDLHLFMVERDGIWRASCDYNVELFEQGTIFRLLGHFQRLLESIAANPETSIGELEMLTAQEKRDLVIERNRTHREYPREATIHSLFEEQVRAHPQKIAVRFGSESVTYAELDSRANRVADVLLSRGCRPDTLVALCVERSIAMVAGLLGILKAGGAYVPIDPSYPAERISLVLEDSKAPLLVTERRLAPHLPKTQTDVILLDEPPPAAAPSKQTGTRATAESLAYVIYTSGSTGRPKGVEIPHRAVVNFLNSMRTEPGLDAADVLLAVTTLSFDIAGLELHLPLTTGATVVIASREMVMDGAALAAEMEARNVTVLQATPATWRLLLDAGWKGHSRLKALCGGEALPPELAKEILPRCGELWNMYGPTETTIWSTCSRVTDAGRIHIGKPIDNTEVYVVDSQFQLLPAGIAGELLIGGDGLARGYHNRADLTAERFIPHPFKSGARLYRTGDLARWRVDGNLDCLGRLDHQVKIRGFRIELGEIESNLARFPGVNQAVVIALTDRSGAKYLAAYVVSEASPHPDPTALREHLRKFLPDYMVPGVYVFLDSLPLTPNGKIDRKALPPPDAAREQPQRDATPPSTDAEIRMAAIFEKVLGTKVTSVHDNFFELGGHSLVAVKLMNAIDREFGIRLPLAGLFDAATVGQLAAKAERPAASSEPWPSLVPIRPKAGRPTLYLVHGAGGNVLLYGDLGRELGDEISLYGFQSQGLDRKAPLLTSIPDMAARYVRELKAHQPVGPYFLGGYCMGGSISYEMARLLTLNGDEVSLVALLDTYNLSLVKRPDNRGGRLSALRQKIGFHFDNLKSLGAKDLFGYLGEKLRMAEEAGKGRLAASLKNFRNAIGGAVEEAGAEAFIQEINHQAAWEYSPQPYAGRVTAFSPRKNYDFFPDPMMGWSELVGDKLEMVHLPVNPHAMLINPFAKQVADELRKRILAKD